MGDIIRIEGIGVRIGEDSRIVADEMTDKSDVEVSAKFVENLFRATKHAIELRAFPSRNRLFTRDPEEVSTFVKRYVAENCFFGVATRDDSGRGTKQNCLEVPALWTDVDFKNTPEREVWSLIEQNGNRLPSVVIYSGGGMHLYHLLDPPANARDERVGDALKGLAKLYKGDRASSEVARVLRLPGTLNHKPEYAQFKPEVKIRWAHWDRAYQLDDFAELSFPRPRSDTPRAAATIISITEGQRHTFICREAGRLRAQGWSAAAMEAELCRLNDRCCRPPLPREEVERIGADIGNKPAPAFDSTEDGLALRFVDEHLGDLRYTASWHRWHRWDGTRWREDVTVKVFDFARNICRDAAADAPKSQRVLRTARTVASVVSLALSDQRIAVVPNVWDSDKWLLNTPEGLVDLRTGKLRSHDPAELITKITSVGPAGDCPMWKEHIELVTGGKRELADYLQRLTGYTLTGQTNEEIMPFLFGPGQNGKDTCVTTLQLILGDYARSVAIGALTEGSSERHPTDLAGLKGARLAVASEISSSSRWDEERIKLLTGGGIVTARFMRGDFFDYLPQFKLWIMGNHKPSLRHVDAAMRRRLHLIPFLVRIISPDKHFKESLRAEWPGILAWAVQGCLAWQRQGLKPPAVVIDATEEYLADHDTLGRWLAERCELDANAQVGSTEAYLDWKHWTEARKEYTGAQKTFAQAVRERGFRQKKDDKMFFVGFRLSNG